MNEEDAAFKKSQAQQLDTLIGSMKLDPAVESQLTRKVDAILSQLTATNGTPCNALNTFDNNVNAKAGTTKGLTPEQANLLYAATARMRAVIGGCGR